MKSEIIKAPCGWTLPLTNSSESWHRGTKRMLLWLHVSESQSVWLATKMQVGTCIFHLWWKSETIFTLITNPNSQDIEQDKKKISFGLTLDTYSKVCLNICQSGGNHELTNLWGQLDQQGFRVYGCVLFMTNLTHNNSDNKNRDKGKQRPFWEEGKQQYL